MHEVGLLGFDGVGNPAYVKRTEGTPQVGQWVQRRGAMVVNPQPGIAKLCAQLWVGSEQGNGMGRPGLLRACRKVDQQPFGAADVACHDYVQYAYRTCG